MSFLTSPTLLQQLLLKQKEQQRIAVSRNDYIHNTVSIILLGSFIFCNTIISSSILVLWWKRNDNHDTTDCTKSIASDSDKENYHNKDNHIPTISTASKAKATLLTTDTTTATTIVDAAASDSSATADVDATRLTTNTATCTSTETISTATVPVVQQQQQQQANHRSKTKQKYYKYCEILIHNVSHTDLVIGLEIMRHQKQREQQQQQQEERVQLSNNNHNTTNTITYTTNTTTLSDQQQQQHPYMNYYVRPRFSYFDHYCRLIYHHIKGQQQQQQPMNQETAQEIMNSNESTATNPTNISNATSTATSTPTIIHFPRYQRSMIDPRYSIREFNPSQTTPLSTATTASTTSMPQSQLQSPPPSSSSAAAASLSSITIPKMAPTGIELTTSIPLVSSLYQDSNYSTDSNHGDCTNGTNNNHRIHVQDTIRIRGRDTTSILSALNESTIGDGVEESSNGNVGIKYIFFPLLATLLPVWYKQMLQKEYRQPVKRVLLLVTGVGTPRNYTHTIHGNSTEICANIMKEFISYIDPTLSVVTIFSGTTNIFRTDENISFCDNTLLPIIHAYRNAHVMNTPYPDEDDYIPLQDETSIYYNDNDSEHWRSTFHVTLSFADGSPARTQAIQSCLRSASYKPTYFHFWQLKTFWHESKIVDDDIEVHSFATMESIPAIDTSLVIHENIYLKAIVTEMRLFYTEMVSALMNTDNDIDRFWLRKSHKPVLAVLLVQSSETKNDTDISESTSNLSSNKKSYETKFRLYRGTNMEVSMPTGSLCAERNAIGSALAMNPNLKRHDLKMIAVLAVPPPTIIGPQQSHQESIAMTMKTKNSTTTTASKTSTTLEDGTSHKNDETMRRITSYSSIVEESLDPNDDIDISNDDRRSQYSSGSRTTKTTNDRRMFTNDSFRKSSIGSDYEPTTTTTPATNTEWMKSTDLQGQTITINPESNFCLPTGTNVNSIVNEPVRRIPLFPKPPVAIPYKETGTLDGTSNMETNISTTAVSIDASTYQAKTKTRRTVVVQSHLDINPLSPCGACNEWLKKIAQSNPYFKIITFTDANCNGMYISPCQD